jgi:hypothetical protein
VDDGTGGRDSHPRDQDRLGRIEQQLAELQAEVARLNRIVSWSGSGPDRGSGDRLQDNPFQGQVVAAADAVRRPADPEVVLTVAFVPSPHSPEQPSPQSPMGNTRRVSEYLHGDDRRPNAGRQVNPVVFVQAPPELLEWALAQPERLRKDTDPLLEGVRKRAAGAILGAVWAPATAGWQVTDFGGFDRLSGLPGHLDDWSHRQIGMAAAQVGRSAGLPPNVTAGAGAVIRYLVPLPVDRSLAEVSRAIKLAGVLAFSLAGAHVLACASLKSLVHDQLAEWVAEKLPDVLSWRPAGPDAGRFTDKQGPGDQEPWRGIQS